MLHRKLLSYEQMLSVYVPSPIIIHSSCLIKLLNSPFDSASRLSNTNSRRYYLSTAAQNLKKE
jgi:hypothetical protein